MTGNPIIIAGPCSAESEDQLFETAKALKEICAVNATLDSKVSDSACCGEAGCLRVSMLRAGLWKPRTLTRSREKAWEDSNGSRVSIKNWE
jgi:hypothetical protein